MALNCRPGDMAYTVAPWIIEGRGRIVRVVRAASPADAGFTPMAGCWYCEGDIVTYLGPVRAAVICDGSLRPIRDPGDDATDETIERLGLPGQLEISHA
jgi:hypothetical protein